MITSVKNHQQARAAHRALPGRDRDTTSEAHAHLDPETGSMQGLLPWLTGLASSGVIEFVPKSDPMLALRDDVLTDYDEAAFRTCLANNARIVGGKVVSQHGRRLFWYDRH